MPKLGRGYLSSVKECKECFSRIFSNLPEKFFCDKLSPYKFSVVVSTLCFPLPCCHRLEIENLVLEIGFLITKLKKCRLHYIVQAYCQKPRLLTTLSISFIGLRFGVPFTHQLLLSARNLTPR